MNRGQASQARMIDLPASMKPGLETKHILAFLQQERWEHWVKRGKVSTLTNGLLRLGILKTKNSNKLLDRKTETVRATI